MKQFKLHYVPFPDELQGKIPAFTVYANGQYTILIDNRNDQDTRDHYLRHELAHLALDHLADTKPLDQITTYGADMFGEGWEDREKEADRYADNMTDKEFAELMQYAI